MLKHWLIAFLSSAPIVGHAMDAAQLVKRLKVPGGFEVNLYTDEAPAARGLALSPHGTVFCGSWAPGAVYAFRDENGDGVAEKSWTVARGLDTPIGVAFKDGTLYASSVDRVVMLKGIEGHLDHPPSPETYAQLWPSESHHGGRYIAFGPDGKLYVPVGSPCNVCLMPDRGLITRVENGKAVTVARGIRNTVGFDWNPKDGKLWFTDNGRDLMGDNIPPDELNCLRVEGLHFGFPFIHGKSVIDPEFGAKAGSQKFEPPAWEFGAHNASLGMRFYRGKAFPAPYRDSIYVALHGSWNRSKKDGYQVLRLALKDGKVSSAEPFLTGFLDGQTTLGRPVDIQELADGSLLVSDDYAGAIYRIRYRGKP